MSARTSPLEVVVAGGGVAALEFVLALNDLAADRTVITIVAPEVDFIYRPSLVGARGALPAPTPGQ